MFPCTNKMPRSTNTEWSQIPSHSTSPYPLVYLSVLAPFHHRPTPSPHPPPSHNTNALPSQRNPLLNLQPHPPPLPPPQRHHDRTILRQDLPLLPRRPPPQAPTRLHREPQDRRAQRPLHAPQDAPPLQAIHTARLGR